MIIELLFEKCKYYVVYSTPCLEKYYRSVAWTPVKLVHMSEISCYPYKGWGIKKPNQDKNLQFNFVLYLILLKFGEGVFISMHNFTKFYKKNMITNKNVLCIAQFCPSFIFSYSPFR